MSGGRKTPAGSGPAEHKRQPSVRGSSKNRHPTEADLLAVFRRLDPDGKAAVMRMVARHNAGVPFGESLAELRREMAL